jgi:hypothetical protein
MNIACQPAQAADNKGKCDPDRIQSEIEKAEAKFDEKELRRKAEATAEFKDKIKGHQVEFNSVYSTWSFDPATCNGLTLKDVNVVHSLRAEGEKESTTNLISHFDPAMKNVARISKQVAHSRYSTIDEESVNYVGYTAMRLDLSTQSVETWSGVQGSFYVPKFSPTGTVYDTAMKDWMLQCLLPCNFTTWVALKTNAEEEIIQTGTGADYLCGFTKNVVQSGRIASIYNCSVVQSGFYEFYPAAAVDCINPTPGDYIIAYIYTTELSPWMFDNILYSIKLTNWTTGQVCSASRAYNKSPNLAQWIGERGVRSNGQSSIMTGLPKFPNIEIREPKATYTKNGTIATEYLTFMLTKQDYGVWRHTMKNGGVSNAEASQSSYDPNITLKWLSSTNAGMADQD